MIRLKNKPNACEDCPFCYKSERFIRGDKGIEEKIGLHCGALMTSPDYEKCPLD